ncbi:hypothetical protein C7999DRAFT_35815 [Corynascus novoguineensis]|uniref:Uncharacterized protein n=1 Tax=Corynascus novoguineensis TaxID=1126955 RepID=A0AAN7CKK5_9PEZI|nr:hypothetical protein C7999DRAFT_35815 [Corynascus novoguineensis]
MSAMSTNWALHRRSIPSRTCSTNTDFNRTSTNLSPRTSSHRRDSIAASTRSSGSDTTTVTVPCISDATGTGIGRIHNQPIRPRVVLFTKDTSGAHALVVINVDEETEPNSERCYCRTKPHLCNITALEQRAGARTLAVHRLAGDRWDVLPLAVPRRRKLGRRGFAAADWRGVARVSLLFRSVVLEVQQPRIHGCSGIQSRRFEAVNARRAAQLKAFNLAIVSEICVSFNPLGEASDPRKIPPRQEPVGVVGGIRHSCHSSFNTWTRGLNLAAVGASVAGELRVRRWSV